MNMECKMKKGHEKEMAKKMAKKGGKKKLKSNPFAKAKGDY